LAVKLKRLFFRKMGVKKLDNRQQRLWSAFEFLVRLLVLSIPLYLIIGVGLSGTLLSPLQSAVVEQSAWVLERMGFEVQYSDVFVTSSSSPAAEPFNFMINEDCTGWKSMLFLFALLFAVPGIALGKRLWGLVFGLPAIWVGNLARVVGVVLAEQAYGVEAALIIHDYLWQAGLIALVLGIWMAWLGLAREKRKTAMEKLKEVIRWPR
jgi:exosortase/archaeosortase family protein